MGDVLRNPRILVVTPEIAYLPEGMGIATHFSAKAGGLADVSAALIRALFEQGADIHVALPDYRTIFGSRSSPFMKEKLKAIRQSIPDERIHLAEDRAFYYLRNVYANSEGENAKISLAFQREVINTIIPRVEPDLIHCHDWMTGLLPAVARQLNIPCLFTVHNIHSLKSTLSAIEDRGIDAASFWKNLYFESMPSSYEQARESNPVDFLSSGIFAAHFVSTVSPTFLAEVVEGRHVFVQGHVRRELYNKVKAGCARGILNAPDPSYGTSRDDALVWQYGPENHVKGKQKNKRFLQEVLGLKKDIRAPLFFWSSRLDRLQKGCQLLAEIMYDMVSQYWKQRLQLVFVADGEFQKDFRDIVRFHRFFDRVAISPFDERLARLAYGAADFVLMPSLFEPCGLPQMIGSIYGALPVAHDTGGIHDTVEPLDVENNRGNGFLFETFDANGLFWAIQQAMRFYMLPKRIKEAQIRRIMVQSSETFTHTLTAQQYIELYEKMLRRPLVRQDWTEEKMAPEPENRQIGVAGNEAGFDRKEKRKPLEPVSGRPFSSGRCGG